MENKIKLPNLMIPKFNGIDYSLVSTKVEYIDDRWMIYVKIPEIGEFCIEDFDLKDTFKAVIDNTLEKYTWWLQDNNK